MGPVAYLRVDGGPGPAGAGDPVVVVADELRPQEAVALDPRAVAGVACAGGGPLSHATILLRSRGIPAVTGLGRGILDVPAGSVVLVDGDGGSVEIGPGPAAVEAAAARRTDARRRTDEALRGATAPAVTRDGRPIAVLANVGGADDAAAAVAQGADGVGMLRTEFAFLGRRDAPGEEEQYLAYRAAAAALGDRRLVVRTLDLGADIPVWEGVAEANPALGNRGLRLGLAAPALLDPQLRAVVRLADERPVGLMFPMVTTVDELAAARARLAALGPVPPTLEVGITVEVPAAALTADAFAPLVDFLAVGTNDLTQYTLAADRANAAVAGLADGLHPAVLRLVREVTAAAERHGRSVTMVGELATDPLGLPLLLGLGVTALSVRPNAVAAVKDLVRRIDLADARALADAALQAGTAAAVRRLASDGVAGRPGPQA